MAKITNYAPGTRGIRMKDGSTVWVDPGQSVDIDKKDVAAMPDLGKPGDATRADGGEMDALKAQVADLTKQVEDANTAKAEVEKKLADAEKSNADLTKQVEELTQPADKKS